MKRSSPKIWFAVAALGAALTAQAATPAKSAPAETPAAKAEKARERDPAKMKVDDIRACMRANFVERGSLRDLTVKATDREGDSHELKMKLFWKPDHDGRARMMLRVLEPKELHGSAYLLLEKAKGEDVFFFVPANKTVLRVTGNEMARPLWGTDFSYSEIKQVQGLLLDGTTKRVTDGTVAERKTFVLETATRQDTTGYKKVLSYIDQDTCTLLKSEFFAKAETPRKVLQADVSTLMQVDNYWLVLGYDMKNLNEGSHTQLTMGDLFLLESKGERMFDPEQFFQVPD